MENDFTAWEQAHGQIPENAIVLLRFGYGKFWPDRGDRIIEIDGMPISTREDFEKCVDAHKPGETVVIAFEQRGRIQKKEIIFAEDPQMEIVPYEQAERALTPAIEEFRQSWLGTKAKTK